MLKTLVNTSPLTQWLPCTPGVSHNAFRAALFAPHGPHLTPLSPPPLCSGHPGLLEILDYVILGHWHGLFSHLDAILSDFRQGWLLLVLQPSRKMALGTPA